MICNFGSQGSGGLRIPWFVRMLRTIDKLEPGDHRYATAFQMYGDGSNSSAYVAELEDAFFRAIRLANGTFKTTGAERLSDLNGLVARHLPDHRPLSVKDVAVSSGVSTVEWSNELRASGIDHKMTATDLTIFALLVSFTDQLRVLFDTEGTVLQVDVAGYPVYPRLSGRVDRLLAGVPSRLAGRFAARQLATRIGSRPGSPPSFVRRLELVTPRLRALGIELREEDLADPETSEQLWDVIRAANILNRGYFAGGILRKMLEGLTAELKVGGVLAVCRTDSSGRNHGSVWRLQRGGSLELLGRVGRGSEIEDLAGERTFTTDPGQ
jgi:hypothetical protein